MTIIPNTNPNLYLVELAYSEKEKPYVTYTPILAWKVDDAGEDFGPIAINSNNRSFLLAELPAGRATLKDRVFWYDPETSDGIGEDSLLEYLKAQRP